MYGFILITLISFRVAFLSHTDEYGSTFLSLSDEFRPEDGQLLVHI